MNLQELLAEVLEYIRGMWRFRWWAVAISWVIALGGWAYVYTLPPVYEAQAKVFVDTNSLLRPLMEGLTAQQDPLDEVQVVSRSVLTRPNLEAVANETDLTLRANSDSEVERIVSSLQDNIRISGGSDNVFTIRYSHRSRSKAVEVVSAVVDRFVEGAIGNQGTDSELTEKALKSEIDSHEQRLQEAERALAEFKRENVGYMPGEAGDYYERLQTAIANVEQKEEEIRQLTQRRDELQRQIQGEEPVFGIMPGGSGGQTSSGCSQSAQISELENQLADLRLNYTDKHPRISRLEETIAQLEARCASERAQAEASGAEQQASGSSSQSLQANPVYQNMRIQLSETEVELASARAELETHEERVEQLRSDVDKISEVETELKQLNRDYNVVQRRHQELLSRWEDLQAKQRLDPVTDQVQFRRIEPPFAPGEPVGPNRPVFLGAVLLVALGGGGGAAFGLSQLFPAFFTRRSLSRAVGVPVIGSVSLILSPSAAARRRLGAIAWAFTYIALLGAAALVIALARPGSELVRALLQGGVA